MRRRTKQIIMVLVGIFMGCQALAQESPFLDNPFIDGNTAAADEWQPVHPDGDVPAARMLTLAHTDALPQFDRLELFAVSFPDKDGPERPKRKPAENTFPVRPYGFHADVHAHRTIRGRDCDQFRTRWTALSFDSLGGAFCHYPVYGVRLYRGDDLIFETTICWQCQNFYLPQYDSQRKRFSYQWYGFAEDKNSQALQKWMQSQLPHPRLAEK